MECVYRRTLKVYNGCTVKDQNQRKLYCQMAVGSYVAFVFIVNVQQGLNNYFQHYRLINHRSISAGKGIRFKTD